MSDTEKKNIFTLQKEYFMRLIIQITDKKAYKQNLSVYNVYIFINTYILEIDWQNFWT